MRELGKQEEKFLKDLIRHAKNTSDDWRKTLNQANIPINTSLEQTYPKRFGPYKEDEKQIIEGLFDRNILKIKLKEKEIHQSLKENKRSKKKDLSKGLGIENEKIYQIIEELNLDS